MKIRADVLRTYQTIHTWTGITTGLLLFIGFFAGAITMYAGVIDEWSTPPTQHLPQVEINQYDDLLQQVFFGHPESSKQITLSLTENTSPVTWYQQGSPRGLRLDDQLWHASLDGNGELIAHTSSKNELSALVDYLHRSAGIAGEVGHEQAGVYVLGVAAILYFLALLSGLIFLLPTLAKHFLALRQDKGSKRFWLDTHNLIGITSLPFHIVIAITVIVFAFHDVLYDGLGKIYGDKPLFPRPVASETTFNSQVLPSITTLIAKANEYAPEHQVKQISLSGLNSSSPRASIQLVSEQHLMRGPKTDFLFMHPYTFEVSSSSIMNGDQGVWGKVVTTLFGLHFGSFGGELGRFGYFIMGILGAVLFYTGNLLWLQKRHKSNAAEQSRAPRVMAKLTIGVALGSLLGVAMAFAVTKWLALTSLNVNLAYMWLYYLCFFAVLLAALRFELSRTAVYVQRLIAVLCISLPLTSLLTYLLPNLGIWPANSAATWALELVAGVIAVVFWHLANKTKHNASKSDSTWALSQSKALPEQTSYSNGIHPAESQELR
ncbi:PepSY-associated TM helix domain-containing protein [Pseudoalteromonas 'SMAR']|uniref:PepSY-associated TM helix domain-containing protein n=1 Tax=Pseudoalteromonas 'SMAR' TaxID=3416908 RepID=UPI003AF242A2